MSEQVLKEKPGFQNSLGILYTISIYYASNVYSRLIGTDLIVVEPTNSNYGFSKIEVAIGWFTYTIRCVPIDLDTRKHSCMEKKNFFCTTARKWQLSGHGAKRKMALSRRECRLLKKSNTFTVTKYAQKNKRVCIEKITIISLSIKVIMLKKITQQL